MRNPGYIELTISVSEMAYPWLLRHYPTGLKLEATDAITEKLYWMAQCEKLALSVSDRRPHLRYSHKMRVEVETFHGSRWNKFSTKRELQLFNFVETRLWIIYVETLIRADLYERMNALGITRGYEDFVREYQYGDVMDYEREVRTYSNHRRSGELLKWEKFRTKNQKKG